MTAIYNHSPNGSKEELASGLNTHHRVRPVTYSLIVQVKTHACSKTMEHLSKAPRGESLRYVVSFSSFLFIFMCMSVSFFSACVCVLCACLVQAMSKEGVRSPGSVTMDCCELPCG